MTYYAFGNDDWVIAWICVATFWTNPQYNVSISGADADDTNGGCGSVVIALMQKHRRRLRKEGKTDLTIGYAVYKVLNSTQLGFNKNNSRWLKNIQT